MDSGQDRLLQFERDLLSGKNICSSEGIFVNFPPSLKRPFQMKGLGPVSYTHLDYDRRTPFVSDAGRRQIAVPGIQCKRLGNEI